MDNITHTLTGLMLARCGLGRGVKGAAVMMMLAANAPDIDTVSGLSSSLSYLDHHRGLTHSLAFSPVLALLPLALVWIFARPPLSIGLYLGSWAAVLSHLTLDLTNVYGVRLLLPFSDRWLRLDITDIVDPWIFAILILSLAAPPLASLVTSEIGGRKNPGPKRGWAWFALLGLLLYESARLASHERALAILNSHLYMGALAQRVTAVPDRLSLLRWRGIVEGEGFVYEVPVMLDQDFDPGAGHLNYPAQTSPALDAVRKTPAFQTFARFNQLPFWRMIPVADGLRVELLDLRFGTVRQPGFMASAIVEPSGVVREARFGFGIPGNNPR
jgi:inner membrane protein